MLNYQPMGFYSPSQLVQDAQRHGVKVLPVDVTISGWDSVLESHDARAKPAVRLGLSLLKGMKDGAAERIETARAVRPFSSVSDLAKRAQLDRQGPSGACRRQRAFLARRQSSRSALAVGRRCARPGHARERAVDDETPVLGAPTEAEDIVADYNSTGLTLGRHPLSLLRPACSTTACAGVDALTYPNGRLARGCGLVTVRQRPGTAKGVMFVTLEDETGNVNVIVWPSLLEKQRTEALGRFATCGVRHVAMRGRSSTSCCAAARRHVSSARRPYDGEPQFLLTENWNITSQMDSVQHELT